MKQSKFLLIAIAIFALTTSVMAQKKNDITMSVHTGKHRQEIIIPQIKGYNVYKADFHTHTIYSDGNITPSLRVREAWSDALDILAITDHIEYRRIERDLIKYMGEYIKEEYRNLPKGVNTNLQGVAADERGILANLNANYDEAIESNQQYGMLIVRGVEITRNEGHYNAIFTTDNNKIYHPDIKQSIQNAVDQGAYVFQNHPKRSKETQTKMTPLAEELHSKGLVRGIEIGNGHAFWGWLVPYGIKNNQAFFSNSDGHSTVAERFQPHYNNGVYRNMTFVLAKKCDEKSIKEAIEEGRVIAYHNNRLIGKEEYLYDLFKASVSIEHLCDNKKETMVMLTNKSSLPYSVKVGKGEMIVHAMSSVQLILPKGSSSAEFTVTNLICGGNKRVKATMNFKRKPTNPYLEANETWYPR
jgi:histidinol phosphatase-like PHP family hydrolase